MIRSTRSAGISKAAPPTICSTSGDHPHGFSLAPVMSIDELFESGQCAARSSIIRVPDDELGEVALSGVVPKFGRTPGRVAHASPRLDEHRAEVLADWLGVTQSETQPEAR